MFLYFIEGQRCQSTGFGRAFLPSLSSHFLRKLILPLREPFSSRCYIGSTRHVDVKGHATWPALFCLLLAYPGIPTLTNPHSSCLYLTSSGSSSGSDIASAPFLAWTAGSRHVLKLLRENCRWAGCLQFTRNFQQVQSSSATASPQKK